MTQPFIDIQSASPDRKRALLVALLREGAARSELGPLSFAQQRLWFIDQMEPGIAAYHIVRALRLGGELKLRPLQQALRGIVARHDSLRTAFTALDGKPVQMVRDDVAVELDLVDLTALFSSKAARDAEALRRAREVACRRFDLESGPLFRFVLFRLDSFDHLLLLVLHHIIGDGWSIGILAHELSALYKAFLGNRPSSLPALPLNYPHYARRQRESLTREAMAPSLAYWKETLAGCPTTLDLPTDHPRPAVQTFAGAREWVALPGPLAAAIKQFSRREGLTLYATVLAAFQALLFRYSGQPDFLVGSPMANRNSADVQGLIGFFVNTLVLRAALAGDPTVRELLGRVRETVRGALAHQDLPFEKLVDEVQPERSLSRSPLCQVALALQNTPNEEFLLAGLTVVLQEIDTGTAKFDLVLWLQETASGLGGFLEYNTDLFGPETILRLWRHFQTLLAGMVEKPTLRLSELPLLGAMERQQLLEDWTGLRWPYPRARCVEDLLAAQARRRPEAVAVVCGQERLTYGELDQRAEALAAVLRRLGVGLETLVVLWCERSVELVVGMVGIWKAGGAYVAMDPGSPGERVEFVLADTQAPVVVTQRRLVERLGVPAASVVCVDEPLPEAAPGAQEVRPLSPKADELAYVIYTSGSTGVPKGVAVTHGGLLNLVFWHQRAYAVTERDRATQLAGLGFDASVWELWPYLTAGASVWMPDEETRGAPERLRDWLVGQEITLSFLPTPLAEVMLGLVWPEGLALRAMLTGGDRLRRWAPVGLPFQLVNHYGPTENTVVAVWGVVGTEPQSGLPPIGRPLPNVQVYLLDAHLNLVPVGVSGELYLGGASLARGYHQRPGLTAERFIPHPFSGEGGQRLYRTGDVCRYQSDGTLQFLGRNDEQVKVRGFRIELGEIEAVLGQHPRVREGVVTLQQGGGGENQLVAYVVFRSKERAEVGELRDYLRGKLPDYMVPGAWVVLDALPLSASGKVNRMALPAPEAARRGSEFAPPWTPTEELLTGIWADVLHLDKVGAHDNFFALGGDSILSIQLIARAQKMGLEVTPKQLFQHQTVAELAAVAVRKSAIQGEQGPVSGPVPLTPIQHWYFEQDLTHPHHFNMAVVLEVRSPLSMNVLREAWRLLMAHHDALRMRFRHEEGSWRQNNAAREKVDVFTRVDLSASPAGQARLGMERMIADIQASLNLTSGPLVRSVWFDLGRPQPSRLLIVAHHLVMDGVSWQILLEDLQAICCQLQQRDPVQLPPKTTSFQAWSERLTEFADNPGLRNEFGFWLAAKAVDGETWPVDLPGTGSENTWGAAQVVSVGLDQAETRALLQEAPRAYRTQINDLLLTALAQALALWTRSRSILIDLEGHGREDVFPGVNLSRTVGWFTTLFPVRLTLPEGSTGDCIKAIKEQLRQVPGRGLGYGLLRYLSNDPSLRERLGELPHAQVSFNYRGQADQALRDSEWFRLAPEPAGPALSSLARRQHLLDVSGRVIAGEFSVDWIYCPGVHERATIEGLAAHFVEALRELIAHCMSAGVVGCTPSDFPLAAITQKQLDALTARHGRIEALYPLSPMQQGMLFHTLLAPASPVYFVQTSWELRGPLNSPALNLAWQCLTDRHAILRTAFHWQGVSEPLQVVCPWVVLPWEASDWSELVPTAWEQRLEAYLEDDRRRGFDFSRAPLLRVGLIRLEKNRYRLVLSFHHILLDGWCLPLLLKELFERYEAVCAGHSLRLDSAHPYREFIAWLHRQELAPAQDFWRKALEGFRITTPLGVDRAARSVSAKPPYQRERWLRLSAQESGALKDFARRRQLTLSTVAQGAWALLLSRCGRTQDIVFGITVAGGAALPGVETMIGLFINTIPLRVRVAEEELLLPWLRKLQEQQTELRQFEHCSLVQIQKWCDYSAGSPLFESILAFENYPELGALWAQNGSLQCVDLRTFDQTNFPLNLVFLPGQQSQLLVRYDGERFDDAAMERLLRHWQTVLMGMLEKSEARLIDVPWMLPAERHQLVTEWNATAREYPGERCVHELFAAQAARRPEAVAIVMGSQRWTYGELDRRAGQWAAHLRALGVGPDVLVGLLVERSVEMIVGMLGILKAGGAYVPLDPSYPAERLAFMLQDTGAAVLLTQRRLVASLPAHRARVLCLDEPLADLPVAEGALLSQVGAPTSEHLAYVMYTSGSTGHPKGVAVRHGGIVRLVCGVEYVELNERTVFLQLAPISFDAATLEIWGPLLHGGRCVVFAERVPTVSELERVIVQGEVNSLWLTASLYNSVIEEGPGALRPLRQLLIGGESLSVGHVRRGLEQLAGTQLINGYGPTEGTTFTCCYRLGQVLPAGAGTVPIGGPIGNTRVYILDEGLEPVPVGVAGELFIGGAGLARGYVNRPELTAERFVPDLFSERGGERLYRTGDLCRWQGEGTIEFLGRKDDQVKVRGYRIELGEIEAVLAQHPAVGQCVVVVREDETGDKRLVGYVVGKAGGAVEVGELRRHLRDKLPEYMVPTALVVLAGLPLSPNGKVDRRGLPAPEGAVVREREFVAPRSEVERLIAEVWAGVLRVDRVGVEDNFFDLGGHSLLLVQVHARLREALGRELSIVDLFQYPTVRTLARFVTGGPARQSAGRAGRRKAAASEDIAVIGMAGRFPGARHVRELWRNLAEGVESIRFFSEEELRAAGVEEPVLRQPNYVRARGVLGEVDLFDAGFFGYSPREAEVLDPQQRIFLEVAWEAWEDAGYAGEEYGEGVGVYAGLSLNSYLQQLAGNAEALAGVGGFQTLISSDKDFLTTRVSYKLNLRGPSVAVQTACSTSLVAVHLACRSLWAGECELALAGGVSVGVPEVRGYAHVAEGIGSPDGHCRAFDERAAGTVGGNGVGVVVLKRLAEALADGDTIHAVIKGTAINNDGSLKVGYTAPGVEGQAAVIAMAQAQAEVNPASIGYIEAHGTGTALGDPIELEALTKVFRAGTSAQGFCAIGSLKTNVGHLDAAAGVAGLIKAVLALERGQIPPSLHFERGNPKIDFGSSPFYVNTRLVEWGREGGPRRAGVSSFGIGGTNAHVVLEEAPVPAPSVPSRAWQLLVLSARSAAALEAATANLVSHLREQSGQSLADVACTLQRGRRVFSHRRVVVCQAVDEAIGALTTGQAPGLFTAQQEAKERPVVFLFPGQGAQYVGMGRELYEQEGSFRATVDKCCDLLQAHLGVDLREVIYPAVVRATDTEQLNQTRFAQPGLFVVEYALAQLWRSWGVEPVAMIGHSIGEYVAGCLAGVFSLEEGLRLVAERGRLMQGLGAGAMLSVPLGEGAVGAWLGEELSLAAVNGPGQCVVSGPVEAVESLRRQLAAGGVEGRRLHTSHAFHSGQMEEIVGAFRERVEQVRLGAPQVPFQSNVTGKAITAHQATDPGYWAQQLRSTVRFSEGMQELLGTAGRVLLEVGPGNTLSSLVRGQGEGLNGAVVLNSLRHPQETGSDVRQVLQTLGRLWLEGVRVDWAGYYGPEQRRRVPLPTYPFERQRYWIEAQRREAGPQGASARVVKNPDFEKWFYAPSWKEISLPEALDEAQWPDRRSRWVLFLDDDPMGQALGAELASRGATVTSVVTGSNFGRVGEHGWQIDPGRLEDYVALLQELKRAESLPDRVVHLWTLGGAESPGGDFERFAKAQELGFYSLLFLGQALAQEAEAAKVRVDLVSSHLHDLSGGELIYPEKATLLGLCRVISQELPNLRCRCVDVLLPASGTSQKLAELLLRELQEESAPPIVAYRGRRRWAQCFDCMQPPSSAANKSVLRQRGVYMITGGLGRVGMALAESLARTVQARLVLVGRTGLPARDHWPKLLQSKPEAGSLAHRIRQVQRLEELGSEVLVCQAEVSCAMEMQQAVIQAERQFGRIQGVVHGAGITSAVSLRTIGKQACEAQFQAKALGVYVLEKVLQGRELDFCLLTSSLAAVLGGLGFSAYASANAFMDAFARRQSQIGTVPWLSVNWDGWQFALQAAPTAGFGANLARLALSPAEGTAVFTRLIAMRRCGQVAISTGDLNARIEQSVNHRLVHPPKSDALTSASPQHPRPGLQTAFVAPRSAIERAITELWQGLLGIDHVGVQDDFFELGGHSLLATQLGSRLREAFGVEVSLQELFDALTVAGQAALIGTKLIEQEAEPSRSRLSAEVELLTDSELNKELCGPLVPGHSGTSHG